MPKPKKVQNMLSQPDGLQAAMIYIFCTQVLAIDLEMIILVNVAVNPAMLLSSR